ncbi:MAG TPA: HipA family kinase [Jatrophihabitans sp.]|nr:HipA family kinase [Jatrophihabitans sp.]
MIETVRATRYVTPLREGGSLPGIVEAADYGTYVVKFRGAGQGLPALVAEVVVAELGRRLGLRIPELRAVELVPAIGRYEADEEVQDLLTASIGLNLGVDFLPGSFGWDASYPADPDEAATVLWLDAFTANVDRSWRNPNLLLWHRDLWLIDHGAALYFHHSWDSATAGADRFAGQPYDSADHVFAAHADRSAALDAELAGRIEQSGLDEVLAAVPDEWLQTSPRRPDPAAVRAGYVEYLRARLAHRPAWLPGAGR